MRYSEESLFKLGQELAAQATLENWDENSNAAITARRHLAQALGILCFCADGPSEAKAIMLAAHSVRLVTGMDLHGGVAEHLGNTWPEIHEGKA